jgi:hypothetical protein
MKKLTIIVLVFFSLILFFSISSPFIFSRQPSQSLSLEDARNRLTSNTKTILAAYALDDDVFTREEMRNIVRVTFAGTLLNEAMAMELISGVGDTTVLDSKAVAEIINKLADLLEPYCKRADLAIERFEASGGTLTAELSDHAE